MAEFKELSAYTTNRLSLDKVSCCGLQEVSSISICDACLCMLDHARLLSNVRPLNTVMSRPRHAQAPLTLVQVNDGLEDARTLAAATAKLLAGVRSNAKMPASERSRGQMLLINVAVSLMALTYLRVNTWIYMRESQGTQLCCPHLCQP